MKRTPSLGAIFLTVVVDLLGFGLVVPFLAKIGRDTFHAPAYVATLVGSSYSLMQFLFIPVWGALSDRVGRRPVLLWSVGATAVSMALMGCAVLFGDHIGWLLLARALGGAATANLGVASAYISDVTRPEERARGMGLIGVGFGIGFVLGPLIGGKLSEIALFGRLGGVPFFVASLLSLGNLLWVLLGIRESLPPERRNPSGKIRSPLHLSALRESLTLPQVGLAILVHFLIVLSFTNLDQTFSLYCADRFGLTTQGTGLVLAFVGVVAALVQGGLVRPLAKRVADATLLRVGIFLQCAAFLGVALASRVGALLASTALLAAGSGLTQALMASFVSTRAPADRQGATLGVTQSLGSLARAMGPAIGGATYSMLGQEAPYVTASLGMLVALFLSLPLIGKIPASAISRS